MQARRLPSWSWVTALTVIALAIVAVVAVQAERSAPPRKAADTSRDSSPSGARESESGAESAAPSEKPQTPVPAGSGEGRRVVYSVGQKRVWLVDASDGLRRTFTVWPGTVNPAEGSYTVGFRREGGTGSDGVTIENVVYFAIKDGISIAFSNAVDGSSPEPSAGTKTGGIRARADDGGAIWTFASVGTTVSVVG
ncbi:hypothetical protein [Streptomyces hypolithicus]